jgi:tRNA(fMet)-specific endonuclease VapC
MYMLDTNICVFLIRKKTPILLGRLQNSLGLLCLSAITLAELRHGVEKAFFQRKIQKL